MTLDTRIYVKDPTDVRALFRFCQSLLGDPEGMLTEECVEPFNVPTIMNRIGQGLPAWLIVHYGEDGPLTPDWDEKTRYPPEPADGGELDTWAVTVSFDTAYSYRGPNGQGCSDLHAWLVREVTRWCDDRRLSWAWENEFTGEVFTTLDELPRFGCADRGALTAPSGLLADEH